LAVTKSWESKVLATGTRAGAAPGRIGWREYAWLAGASVIVGVGLLLVYSAKTREFPALSEALARGELLDLNQVSKPEQLLPFFEVFADEDEREAVASKVFDYLASHRPLPNVGALARLRSAPRVSLLPFAKLKPAFVVRTPAEFQKQFLIWIALYLAAFHVVFLTWRWSAFRGDFALLPAIHLITGIGLVLAVSLRDPLRDTLEFSKFAWGWGAQCCYCQCCVF
jgi:hypothetical protein